VDDMSDKPFIVLVTGGRKYNDKDTVNAALSAVKKKYKNANNNGINKNKNK